MTPHPERHLIERHRSSVMSLLIVTSATSMVMCFASSSTPFNPTRKFRHMPGDFRPQYNQIYQVEKLKAQILRGLNLTAEPIPPIKKPRQQHITSILNRLPLPGNRTHVRPPVPDAIVWSEPVDTSKGKADQLLFRVNNQKEKSTIINRVTLLLRLRFKQHSKKKRKTKTKSRKKVRVKFPKARKKDAQNAERRKGIGKKNLKSKSRKKTPKVKSRRKKSRRVKLLVQVKNDKTGKFKRVAVQRVTVSKKFSWIKVPIPASLVSRAAQSMNQSLVLRVRCKRCSKGGVSIDNALPRKKSRKPGSESNASLTLNPNRPYLVICTAKAPLPTLAPASLPRSARHVDALCPSQSHASSFCCAEPLTMTFKDLGLDRWIVYPSRFTTVVCDICKNAAYKQRGKTIFPNGRIVLPQKQKEMTTRQNLFVSEDIEDSVRAKIPRDKSSSRVCHPRDSSSLTVMYYSDKNTLLSAEIPHLVSNSCMCSFVQ